jgi:hypothetical protein
MGDDHGWDETAYNGHPHLKTPVLDEMAATGLRLDRFLLRPPVLLAHPRQRHHRPAPESIRNLHPGASIRPEEISVAQVLKQPATPPATSANGTSGP